MKRNKIRLNTQSKFILSGLLLGTILISYASFFALNEIQNKADKSYSEFAQMLTRTLAGESSEITNNNISYEKKHQIIKNRCIALLANNTDISYIEYKNNNNEIIYSTKNDFPVADENTVLNVSSPIISDNNKIEGSVTLGLTGNGQNFISSDVKKILSEIFVFIWAIFAAVLLLNMFFMAKEYKKIYKGVKSIATGQFGYKLESENMEELTDAFNDMSNILSRYEEQNIEQLTLERNKLEAVLMSIINGVIVCDNTDSVVLANSAALKMLDIDEKHLLNEKIQNYIDSHGQKCFLEKIEEFKDTPLNIRENKPIEFNIDVAKKVIKAMISPMFSKMQDYVGYIIVLIDITRETEVNKLKNTFISNVSHELRTPVTVLRTYIDTLCHNGDDFDEETKKEFMVTIDNEAKRLHGMVNDILDFSRLESGNVVLKKEYFNIAELIEQNINSIKILADEKNIKINFEKEESLPLVPINAESIDRVMKNLLSNAIKYSLDGKDIFVSLKKSDDNNYIEIKVKDNGIGIAKEHLEKIFDRFYRVENAVHTVKGTGLGLHLVKMTIEEHHHGKVSVTSIENEGSTFTVLLPLIVDDSELA